MSLNSAKAYYKEPCTTPLGTKNQAKDGAQILHRKPSLSTRSEPDRILASALQGGDQIDVSKNECDSAAYSYSCCGPDLPLAAPDSATRGVPPVFGSAESTRHTELW